jgi:hypothetical protein
MFGEVDCFIQAFGRLNPHFPEGLKAGFIKRYGEFLEQDIRGDALFEALLTGLGNHLGLGLNIWVAQGEGETLEEAVKRRGEEALTEEAARALEKLLGGN